MAVPATYADVTFLVPVPVFNDAGELEYRNSVSNDDFNITVEDYVISIENKVTNQVTCSTIYNLRSAVP